jgi:hypothetical protein
MPRPTGSDAVMMMMFMMMMMMTSTSIPLVYMFLRQRGCRVADWGNIFFHF